MIFYAILLALATTTTARVSHSETGQPVSLADPFVLKHDGLYYLYGTGGGQSNNGIPVYTSKDGQNWKPHTALALTKGQCFGDKGFWAPEVYYHNKQFYMFYTANEHIAVATSNSPLGPFTQKEPKPLHDNKEIDPHVFVDDNGKSYLYFVRFDHGNKTYGAELNEDWQSIKQNTLTACITNTQPWEIISGEQWPVTEAPAMLKHKKMYYLFYTANDFRSPAYNVGYATSTNPLGPFVKYEGNPIIPKTDSIEGTGHCTFVQMHGLKMYYHKHKSPGKVGPRETVYSTCKFVNGILQVEKEKIFPIVK